VAAPRTHVTLVMNWDGKNVTAILNPGPDATPIASVSLDVTTWTIRFEADAKDSSGKPVHIVAEGRLDDIGSYTALSQRDLGSGHDQGRVQADSRLRPERDAP
jgi:hypothetical protein